MCLTVGTHLALAQLKKCRRIELEMLLREHRTEKGVGPWGRPTAKPKPRRVQVLPDHGLLSDLLGQGGVGQCAAMFLFAAPFSVLNPITHLAARELQLESIVDLRKKWCRATEQNASGDWVGATAY